MRNQANIREEKLIGYLYRKFRSVGANFVSISFRIIFNSAGLSLYRHLSVPVPYSLYSIFSSCFVLLFLLPLTDLILTGQLLLE